MKNFILAIIDSTANDSTYNAIGATSTTVAFLNSFFQMLNPVLTGIFYVASIGWLGVQIYYKVKNKGK